MSTVDSHSAVSNSARALPQTAVSLVATSFPRQSNSSVIVESQEGPPAEGNLAAWDPTGFRYAQTLL